MPEETGALLEASDQTLGVLVNMRSLSQKPDWDEGEGRQWIPTDTSWTSEQHGSGAGMLRGIHWHL